MYVLLIDHIQEKITHIQQSLSLDKVQQQSQEGQYDMVLEQLIPVLNKEKGSITEV